jgi:alanine-glyoxylate transaminase/serine-glyoxylate transaminase/serine-pyruvate transaminase
MRQIVERCGGVPITIEAEWGRPILPEQVEAALQKEAAVKIVALVHAETSTGVLQPLEGLGEIATRKGALLLVDAVTSLAGHPVWVDRHGVDVCYSGTQKVLNAPPGLAPLTMSERAVAATRKRSRKVQSYYLDVALFEQYWGTTKFYHHTPPVSLYYALLKPPVVRRKAWTSASSATGSTIWPWWQAGAMGLAMHVEPAYRLWTLNAVRIPDGVDDAKVRGRLLQEFGIEIGGGLGSLKGKVWRVGLMGMNSTANNVLLFLAALERTLRSEGIMVAAAATSPSCSAVSGAPRSPSVGGESRAAGLFPN